MVVGVFVGQARKPLVEKQRRARINKNLEELRLLVAAPHVREPSIGSAQKR